MMRAHRTCRRVQYAVHSCRPRLLLRRPRALRSSRSYSPAIRTKPRCLVVALVRLTVVADWVGSNRERGWLPYQSPVLDLSSYWREAQAKARTAIIKAGLSSSASASELSAQRLFPDFAERLSPLQQHVFDMALPDGPMLAVIKDVTGRGKTEAALLLAAQRCSAHPHIA